jgi:hypothetical protein
MAYIWVYLLFILLFRSWFFLSSRGRSLLFLLFGLFISPRKALLGAVEGAVEKKAVTPRIASREEDRRHHRGKDTGSIS